MNSKLLNAWKVSPVTVDNAAVNIVMDKEQALSFAEWLAQVLQEMPDNKELVMAFELNGFYKVFQARPVNRV